MDRNDELLREIRHSREENKKQFDTVKITIGTAGLLVALGLNTAWSKNAPLVWFLSAYKLVLLLILLSMFSVALSLFIKEVTDRWLERVVMRGGPTLYQRLVVRCLHPRLHQKAAKLHSFLRIHAPDWCINTLGYVSSLSLIAAIVMFAYLASYS